MRFINLLINDTKTQPGYALASAILVVGLFAALGVVELPFALANWIDCGAMLVELDYSGTCV